MYHHDSITDFGPFYMGFPGSSVVKNLLANKGAPGNVALIPGLGKSPGGGNGNPRQYSCLENPMDRGAWWVTIHEVANWTWLSTHTPLYIFTFNTVLCFHVLSRHTLHPVISISGKASLVMVQLFFLLESLISPSLLKDSFAWSSFLGWHSSFPLALWLHRPTPSRPIIPLLKHLLRSLWSSPVTTGFFLAVFKILSSPLPCEFYYNVFRSRPLLGILNLDVYILPWVSEASWPFS